VVRLAVSAATERSCGEGLRGAANEEQRTDAALGGDGAAGEDAEAGVGGEGGDGD
jgi:hypothetical protein